MGSARECGELVDGGSRRRPEFLEGGHGPLAHLVVGIAAGLHERHGRGHGVGARAAERLGGLGPRGRDVGGEGGGQGGDVGHAISLADERQYRGLTADSTTAEGATISRVGFIIGEILFLAVVQVWGGPPWTLVGVVAFVLLAFSRPQVGVLAAVAPSLIWLGLAQATGNRELFFPFAMHLAAVVVCRLADHGTAWAALGGSGVVAAFLAIRVAQQATPRVLAVECAVAAAILVAATIARLRSPRRVGVDAAIITAAAVLAYAGLAL